MKKYLTLTIPLIVAAFIAGVVFVDWQVIFGADLQNPGRKLSDVYENKTLLNATSTAGNSSRHATSSPIQIGGAKKVTLQFAVEGTTTVASADFCLYVSASSETPDTQSSSASYNKYERFTDLVGVNGSSPTTADSYFTRTGATCTTVTPAANGAATSTVAMDLTYGAWRSMLCTASSSRHDPATCNALIEY